MAGGIPKKRPDSARDAALAYLTWPLWLTPLIIVGMQWGTGWALLAGFAGIAALGWWRASGRETLAVGVSAFLPPCAVCGGRNNEGHGCHVEALARVSSRVRRTSRYHGVYSKAMWSGVVRDRHDDLSTCKHSHASQYEAHRCAHSTLRHYQRGRISAANVIGPRPKATTAVRRIPIGDLPPAAWAAMLRKADYRCHYCKEVFSPAELHREHRTPLSRGGANSASNIVPSCAPCNLRKATRTEAEYREFLRRTAHRPAPRQSRRKPRHLPF